MTHNLAYIEYEDSVDPSVKWDFEFNPNTGRITCMQCSERPTWCVHMSAMTPTNSDTQGIWEAVGLDGLGDPTYRRQFVLDIPMFPTSTLWTQVILTNMSDRSIPMYAVEWEKDGAFSDTKFICHITKGEGRNSIREMLIEYMWADSDRAVECQAAHHGPAAQANWEALINGVYRTREAWSVYMTDWCTYCTIHQINPDDLVPEAQNTGVWNG